VLPISFKSVVNSIPGGGDGNFSLLSHCYTDSIAHYTAGQEVFGSHWFTAIGSEYLSIFLHILLLLPYSLI
jgi:hypothetical protein